ncbi:hypothetical protein MSMEI_3254 [Mycolicibacterium smegmatis MC2 155]|uniref:Uncharacterized protein n=1 Tax=Mycolicibacterium smegmatis (strain ATCC 700084 / mc(2)155) TaxID=246196 RepID=I7G1P5_MYCS2|nr:hypothetical protein MSMEI_3254 [Mycolicibacterium smegmatis MC2 155]
MLGKVDSDDPKIGWQLRDQIIEIASFTAPSVNQDQRRPLRRSGDRVSDRGLIRPLDHTIPSSQSFSHVSSCGIFLQACLLAAAAASSACRFG